MRHRLTTGQVQRYCKFAEEANLPIVEVGHGNGLGASSILIGEALTSDIDMLRTAKRELVKTKLAVHVIPGISSRDKDLSLAIHCGVDVFRVASHCTEATVTKSYFEFLVQHGKEVHGVLMMTALADVETLVQNALVLQSYGASAVIIMDSTGTYIPVDVAERVQALRAVLCIDVGFHAHNNLGCAVANSLAAVQNGATYIDVCMKGFGAGAGNAPLEVVIPVFDRVGWDVGVDFARVVKEADDVTSYMIENVPYISPINVLTGIHKLFSGFETPIKEAAKMYDVHYYDIIVGLGSRKVIAGQEDIILQVAEKIAKERHESTKKHIPV